MAREQLKTLTEPMYYILLSLLKENHGYGIMQMVEELTDGRVAIGAGTLYSLLSRFEKEGFINQVAEEHRRKIYLITEKGETLLQEEYTRLNYMVEDGKKFFRFEGQRKEPPEDGGGTETVEEKGTESTEKLVPEQKRKHGENADGERKEKNRSLSPNRRWSPGGAY
ncbi:MAG: PadR family transcriptional regulator [Emergencia sp.]